MKVMFFSYYFFSFLKAYVTGLQKLNFHLIYFTHCMTKNGLLFGSMPIKCNNRQLA